MIELALAYVRNGGYMSIEITRTRARSGGSHDGIESWEAGFLLDAKEQTVLRCTRTTLEILPHTGEVKVAVGRSASSTVQFLGRVSA
jgi:hypothetical protein